MYFVEIACFFNIILDYLFIGYFDLHAMGAALGTVGAQVMSVIIAFIVIYKRKLIQIHKEDFKVKKSIILDVIKIGFPICIQDGFIQISFIIITIIANSRGVDVAAAVGVVEKIIGFCFLVPSSMLSAISAICAQCIGTKQHQRAKDTLKYGIIIALSFGILFTILCQFISKPLVSLFSQEQIVIMYGGQYLRSYIFDCIFAAISFGFSGYFTAYGYSIISFIHNFISILTVRIPGAYLASYLFPDNLFPMGLASPAGSLLSAIICIIVYQYMKKHHKLN